MANPVYMTLTGENSGQINGSVAINGREDTIEIIEIDHHVHIPTDLLSGRISGARQHKPFQVRAMIDKSTPLIYKAVCEGESFTEVVFKFYRTAKTGMEEHFFTIRLEDAKANDIRLDVPNVKNDQVAQFPEMVIYAFMYRRITWTYEDGGIEHTDDWLSR